MKDGFEDSEPAGERSGLSYPFAEAPQPGTVTQVAPGVMWLRMPLPFSLDHINLWAIREADSWTIVDTGIRTNDTLRAWTQLFAGALGDVPVGRVICTHMHPDHIGLAGWLTRRFGARLWTTRLEYLTCRLLVADTGRAAPAEALTFYKATGWPDAELELYKGRFGDFGRMIHEMPDSYRRVSDGEVLDIGGYRWRAIVGRGHSPEHLCLHCADLGIFISGDQVLPKISSNVSVFPTEPDADPLGEWMESLERLQLLVPDEVLVLPAHNLPFRGLHHRLEHLRRSHERSLDRLRDALTEPRRVLDVFSPLYRRTIDSKQLGLATGEALAHLNYLIARGQALRTRDADGIDWYRAS